MSRGTPGRISILNVGPPAGLRVLSESPWVSGTEEAFKGLRQGCLEGKCSSSRQENSHPQLHEGGASNEPILRMIKLRHREVEGCAQHHTACHGGARMGTRPDSQAGDPLGVVTA